LLPIKLDMDTTTRSKFSAEQLTALLREINAAIRKLGIYPPGHPASVRAAERPFTLLEELLQSGERVIFAVADGKLIGNGKPLDDRTLQDGLGRVLQESGLSSITFESGLSFSPFEKFLAHLNQKKEQRDLQTFLQNEGIKAIAVGKVQYQLVGEDERVVSTNMADGLTQGGGEIEATIADSLRKHPTLLLQLLSRGRSAPDDTNVQLGRGGFAGGSGAGGGPTTTGAAAMPALGPELLSFTNEELMGLLVVALRESVSSDQPTNRFEMGQTLFALKEVLTEREALNLVPQLQQSLIDLNMVDPKYLELIFASDSSPRKVAHTEIQRFKSDFSSGTIAPEQADEFLGWLRTINTEQYSEEILKSLYSEAETQGYLITDSQRLTLQRLATLCSQQMDSPVAQVQLSQIRERLSDPSLSGAAFAVLADQLEVFYLRALETEQYGEANSMLSLICQKFDTEIIYADGVAEYASQVHQRFTSTRIAEGLISKLKANFQEHSKSITPLLENFNTVESILVFTAYIAHDHRGIRVMLLRLLSGFGARTVAAFRLLFSDRTLTARPAGQNELPQDSWYKVRNLIFVLSNIKHPDAVSLVKGFAEDRDKRVVLEAVNALERLGGEEAAQVCARLLSHPLRDVQVKALQLLVGFGVPQFFPAVEDYFVRNAEERGNSLPALIKLDRQHAVNFLAAILLGESETYNKYYSKPDEELNETIVSTFIQLRSTVFDDVLRKYVKAHTRSLLDQLRKPNSVKIAERYLRTTSSGL
jgi:hypothetical protein